MVCLFVCFFLSLGTVELVLGRNDGGIFISFFLSVFFFVVLFGNLSSFFFHPLFFSFFVSGFVQRFNVW